MLRNQGNKLPGPPASNDPQEMIESDLHSMSELYFNIDFEKKTVFPDYDYLRAIVALILEAQLKYEFDTQGTIDYLEQLIFKSP